MAVPHPRTRLVIVTILALMAPVGLAQDPPADPFASRGVEWQEYFNAGEPGMLAQELYTEDARFLTASGIELEGHAELEQTFQAYLDQGLVRIDTESSESGSSGDLAYDAGTYAFTLEDGTVAATGNYVTLLRPEDGQWKIFFHMARATPEAPPAE